MSQDIYIIEDRPELIETCREIFQHEKRELKLRPITTQEVEVALRNIPALIIIDEDNTDVNIIEFCKSIRENEDNSITPIIVVSSNTDRDHRTEVLKAEVEYYIKKPIDHDYFYFTVKNIINLLNNNRKVSPLTGLPGNVQIQAEMKKRLLNREVFAILYFDLDNFKAYNDKYGFMNGDEVIKFTANCMREALQEYGVKGDFLGHIGGDDFVSIVSYENARKIGKEIIRRFTDNIGEFYSEEDNENGYIKLPNRRGKMEKYPLMTLTVAMVSNKFRKYNTVLELGEDGAAVKKKAKTIPGSTFLENRRKGKSHS
jgi:diguanylate cyclase (GGDEF)-like protein